MADGETCGGCGHAAKEHIQQVGCTSGWTYDDQGVALAPNGCPCQWAHISSPTEKEARRAESAYEMTPTTRRARHVVTDPRGGMAVCYCDIGHDHEGAVQG